MLTQVAPGCTCCKTQQDALAAVTVTGWTRECCPYIVLVNTCCCRTAIHDIHINSWRDLETYDTYQHISSIRINTETWSNMLALSTYIHTFIMNHEALWPLQHKAELCEPWTWLTRKLAITLIQTERMYETGRTWKIFWTCGWMQIGKQRCFPVAPDRDNWTNALHRSKDAPPVWVDLWCCQAVSGSRLLGRSG